MSNFHKGDTVQIVSLNPDAEITIEASMGLPIPKIGTKGKVLGIERGLIAVLLDGYDIEILFDPEELEHIV